MKRNSQETPPLKGENNVLTWNLQWGSEGVTWDRQIVMPILKAHQIGLLQEVPMKSAAGNSISYKTLKEQLKECGYKTSGQARGVYSFLTYWKDIGIEDENRGFLVESCDGLKWPIAWFMRDRGCWLINVHLRADQENKNASKEDGKAIISKEDTRIKDIETLVARVLEEQANTRHEDRLYIWLGGDFNTATLDEFKKLLPILEKIPNLQWCTNHSATYTYQTSLKTTGRSLRSGGWRGNFGAKDYLLTSKPAADNALKANTLFNPPSDKPIPSGHFPVSTGHYPAVVFTIGGILFRSCGPFGRLGSIVCSADASADGYIRITDNPNDLSYVLSRNENTSSDKGKNVRLIPKTAYLRYSGKSNNIKEFKGESFEWHHAASDEAASESLGEETLDKDKIVPIAQEVCRFVETTGKHVPEVLEDLAFIADRCNHICNDVPEGESELATSLLSDARKYHSLASILCKLGNGATESAVSDETLRIIQQCSAIVDGNGPIAERVATQITIGKGSFARKDQKLLKQNKDCNDAGDRPWWWQRVPLRLAEVVSRLELLAKRLRKL